MITEKGTLPVGIDFGEEVHQEIELRPVLVSDQLDAEQADTGLTDSEKGLAAIVRQVVAIGRIPRKEITLGMLKTAAAADVEYMAWLREGFELRLRYFRKEQPVSTDTPAGAA